MSQSQYTNVIRYTENKELILKNFSKTTLIKQIPSTQYEFSSTSVILIRLSINMDENQHRPNAEHKIPLPHATTGMQLNQTTLRDMLQQI